ncbi:mitochondrial inner membrane protein OXA1L isoform X1 [Planococcus citri]|uniref:mitochondrial inner membrane protein OXA1L isoform X1 n=1 Tax=Planococcus citri TaxID=170843 RepID=UPI0031F7B679
MILSKSILLTRNTFLSACKLHKLHSCNFHILQAPLTRLNRVNVSAEPLILSVIYRLESSQAPVIKDAILTLPKTDPVAATAAVSDGLPAIPVPGVDVEIVTAAASQLPEIIAEAVVPLNKLGEPTLESIGLGSYFTPIGWVQHWLEFLHVSFNLPWWGAIATTVVLFRMLLFPLVIQAQRNAVKMHNVMPLMMEAQQDLQAARVSGNQLEALKAGQKLSNVMTEHKVNPLKSFVLPMIQAPVFISFFFALKKMSSVPVESMTTGGALWFVDLTIPDQYYLLPLITSATLYAIIEVGVDTGKISMGSEFSRYINFGMKFIPVIAFPFMMGFPSGVCIYWMTTNFASLTQVAFLKIPAVREYFEIEVKKKHEKTVLNKNKKGIVKDFKSSISNMRIAKDISDRDRLDQASFARAGRLPPAKTFKHNPIMVNKEVDNKKKFSLK